MKVKKNLLVLFGGMSTEHDVSQMSVLNVLKNIDLEVYTVHIVGITRMGRWIYVPKIEDIETKSWIYGSKNAYLLPDAEKRQLLIVEEDERDMNSITIDVCFPVLHGKYGEDGSIQGLLELSGISYVGSDVLSSAVCLDKVMTKKIIDTTNINQAKYISFIGNDINVNDINNQIEKELSYPVFVKPANAGSSVGISKVNSYEELENAINLARSIDNRIVIEEEIIGRELECAVISDGRTKPLSIGEIIPAAEFYDFDAKYHNINSQTIVSPSLPNGTKEEILNAAKEVFDVLGCYSFARVDFFLEENTNRVIFNEINTIPGFTAISMFPKLAQESGMSNRELIKALLESAEKRG